MDLLIVGQPRLERWEARECHPFDRRPGDRADAYERDLAPEEPGPPGARFAAVAAEIRGYRIFPRSMIEPVIRRPVEVGDTVGAHFRGFPLVRIFFASRVVATFDGDDDGWWVNGFTYRTLRGHPEHGEETFTVEKELATGRVRVALRSWSRPGTWVTRLGAPILRRVQVRASERALDVLAQSQAI